MAIPTSAAANSKIDQSHREITGRESDELTNEEWSCALRRRAEDCRQRMAGGPLYALIGGGAAVMTLSSMEAYLSIRPKADITFQQGLRFTFRYSISQLIPSIIWWTVPSCKVAQVLNINPSNVYASALEAPPRLSINLIRLQALRGAIAGSVILSQVFALMDVISHSQHATANRIALGREPPLDDVTRNGVVVRLAGESSQTTNLTMAREGRRHLFPIFENPAHLDVINLLKVHGSQSSERSYNMQPSPRHFMYPEGEAADRSPVVPIYWQVNDERYSHKSSWHGLRIPENWLYPLPSGERLLLLEADTTSGTQRAMSLRRNTIHDSDDLNLYEVAQGFTQLKGLVDDSTCNGFKSMRVLLLDPEASYESGGGRKMMARQHTVELGLADVIVDARTPLVYLLTKWLCQFDTKTVILETPNKEWFKSLQRELKRHGGYNVVDISEAQKKGSLKGIPFLVYEKTTADTFHTVRQYQRQLIPANQICGLCPRPWSLEGLVESRVEGAVYLSSGDVYDRLLRWVRKEAIAGNEAADIQHKLDTNLPAIMDEIMRESIHVGYDLQV